MTSTTTGVPPQQQPLRPAIALAIISLVSALMSVLGVVAAWVLAATGLMDSGAWVPSPSDGSGFALAIVVLSLLGLLLLLVGIGIQLASFILSLIVVIRGDGKLRTGAAILLAMSLFGVFFSVTLDLPSSAGAITNVITFLGTAVQVLRWCGLVAGVAVLWLGIGEVRRARAAAQRPGLD